MLCNRLIIRQAAPDDRSGVLRAERQSYGRQDEASMVDRLMPAPNFTLSLVAECDGSIIGHVLLTEIGAPLRAVALAPLAVVPAYREMQVGSLLVRRAIEEATRAGYEAIFVHGQLPFYERFGFSSTLADAFTVGWQGPRFMALELAAGALAGKSGKLDYPAAFLA